MIPSFLLFRQFLDVGSQVYQWYEGSLSRQGNGLSISLTENAQTSQKNQLPFESVFEQSFLMGAVSVKGDFPPLSSCHLSTAALVRTSDGFYEFAKRAQNGTTDLFGGGVQPEQLAIGCGADLEENLYKEIREEAGLCRSDVEGMTGMGAVVSGTSNVILVVALLRLTIGCGEIEARFSARTEEEMAELIFVPEVELKRCLDKMTDYRNLFSNLLETPNGSMRP